MASSLLGVAIALLMYTAGIVSGAGDPILLVPGITGSQLDVRHTGFTLCNTLGQTISLWVNELRIVKFGCFSDEMMLSYNRDLDQYSDIDDSVTVSVPGFGDTSSVEDLGRAVIPIPYFGPLVEYFVDRGYERGKSIRAAPYDWRLAPDELQRNGYYDNMKSLIEEMYRENGNTKVTIVAHSMGGPVTLHFLTSGIVSQAWLDKFIGNFIPLSGAWSGGNTALQAEISGLTVDEMDLFFGGAFASVVSDIGSGILDLITPIVRTLQSIPFLLPRPSVWGDTVLVTTPTRMYTANDYEELFEDIGFTDGFAMFQGIADINENFPAPSVPTHCFYGVGVSTPESFNYRESFPRGARSDPEIKMGDGDGTVNIRSSEVCLQWANSGSPFKSTPFSGVNHLAIVQDEAVLREIGSIVGANAKQAWWPLIFGQPDDQN